MTVATLRKATPADAATLGVLHVVSWRETYAGIVPDEMLAAWSVESRTAMWSKVLHAPGDFDCAAVFIAEDDERAIGFGSCGRQRDETLLTAGFTGEFGALYVLRSHQGRSVGRSIMAAMARELYAAGHISACLWVLRRNELARAFYEYLGGIIVGERIDRQPAITLIKDAYGWRDVASLCSQPDTRSASPRER